MKLSSTLVMSIALAASVLTIRAQQSPPASPPDAPPAAAQVVEPPDKPTWAYAVAPGAQVAGAPKSPAPRDPASIMAGPA
jgi:hypothetical protein